MVKVCSGCKSNKKSGHWFKSRISKNTFLCGNCFKLHQKVAEKSNGPLLSNIKKVKAPQSEIFNHSDDPDVVEILKKEEEEAKKVTSKEKKRSLIKCDFESPAKRQRENPTQTLIPLLSPHSPPLSLYSPPLSPSLMISPILCNKVSLCEDCEIEEGVTDDADESIPDLDELLKLPERPIDGSKTKDEILDEFDKEIAERQRRHEEEMARVDVDIEAEKEKNAAKKLRMKDNAKVSSHKH